MQRPRENGASRRRAIIRRAGTAALAIVLLPFASPGRAAGDSLADARIAIRKSGESVRRFTLENGMICLVKEDHSAPVVAVRIWVGTGAIHEQEFCGAGLSHYIEHMIFKGTPSRPGGQITKEINNTGGSINAYTSHDRTVFHAELPSRHWKVGVDVLSDAVMHAAFPEDEWQKEKDVILREQAMGNDSPDSVISKLLWRTAFRVHPYQYPVIGYSDTLRAISRDDLLTFFRRNYVPDNMVVVVVGDVNPSEVAAYLEELLAGFQRRPRPPVVLPQEPRQTARRFVRQTGAYSLSRLGWVYHSVPLSDPDAPALDLIAEITGHGRSSRLVQALREKARLVHDIEAWSYTPKEAGLFGIEATFDPDKEEKVLRAIHEEIESWRAKGFSRREIEKARRMVLASTLSALQTAGGQANDCASGEFYAADPRFSETYLARLEQITPKSLRAVVNRHLREENETVVVLAPEAKAPVSFPASTAAPPPVVKVPVSPPGLRLLVRKDRRLPSVCFSVVLGGGLLSEEASNNGLTRLMSEMLVRGTGSRSGEEIALEVESLGASLAPFSGINSFGLQARCLTADADTLMELMADCLLDSRFPADELEKQKNLQIAAIAQQRERPLYLAQEALRGALFPNHPYRWDTLGSSNVLRRLAPQDLREHLRKHVVSGNIVVSIFGDITPERAKALVETHLRRAPVDIFPIAEIPPPRLALPVRLVQRVPKEQAILLAGYLGVGMKDPRRDALQVLDTALSGLSSGLGEQVREKRGLAYYVGAYHRSDIGTGHFVLYAGTREDAVPLVEGLFSNEVARLTTQGLSEEEITRARSEIVADHDMSLQDNMGLSLTCAINELLGLGYDHSFKTRQRFEAVTAADIRDAAAYVLSTNRMAVSLVLPEGRPEKPE